MINPILKKHFHKEEEEEMPRALSQSPIQQQMQITPEMIKANEEAKEKFIKNAKSKLLGKPICKSIGCQNLRSNGSSRCSECSEKYKNNEK